MWKKILSYMVVLSLMVSLFAIVDTDMVYANESKLNPDDMENDLNNISIIGQTWESMGFQSEDIARIMKLPRKEDSFYKGMEPARKRLLSEKDDTRQIEDSLPEQNKIMKLSQDGNPPQSAEEQNARLKYVTQVALDRYGSLYNTQQFNKYIVYLYMSHYIDNPNYTTSNPGFDNIYAYVITDDDIKAYDNFIAQTKYSAFTESVINFVNDYKTLADNIETVSEPIIESKLISLNTATAVFELKNFEPDKMETRAKLIIGSFINNYENAVSAEALIDYINEDLKYEDVGKQYIDTCVTGLIEALAGTTTILGFGLSISICYYNMYMNLYDKAKITALHYSLSGRVAERLDVLLWE